MDPVTGAALISGAAGLIGGSMANAQASHESTKSRGFARWQMENSHQLQVNDLRAAGLNPILSANSGASASVGPSAPVNNAIGEGIASAADAIRIGKELKALNSQTALNEATAEAQKAQSNLNNTSAKQVATQTEILKKTGAAAIKKAGVEEKQADWDIRTMDYRNTQQRINDAVNTLNNAKDLVTPFRRGEPGWIGTGSDGTKYHKQTGEVLRKKGN